jgi:hypothetical protein
MTTIENIVSRICGVDQTLAINGNNITFVADTSGSTDNIIKNGKRILNKILEVIKDFVENNPNNEYNLITFGSGVKHIGKITMLDDIAIIPNESRIISNGGTYTAYAYNYVNDNFSTLKPDIVITLTDGETSNSPLEITNSLSKLKARNVKNYIIAVSDSDIDMNTCTSREESNIPGMELINYAGALIDELTIYSTYHYDTPFQGSRKASVDKNCLKFFDMVLPKEEGQPRIYILINFIDTLIEKITEHIGTIDWGSKDRSFKKLCAEIGILLIIIDPINYPESNSYILNIAQRLSQLVPTYTSEKVIGYFKYGYDCSRNSKHVQYTNIEGHVQEAVVKHQSFADGINLLSTQGSIASSNIVISFPIDGSCLIIEQEGGLAY